MKAAKMIEEVSEANFSYESNHHKKPPEWMKDRWEGARLVLSILIDCFSEEEAQEHWNKFLGRKE